MDAVSLLKISIDSAHQILEGTLNGVDDGLCHKLPDGEAHPIGATYAHTLASEDFLVNTAIAGKPPLMAGEWAGKTGMSEPPPGPGGDLLAWAKKVKIDLDQTRKYGQAVYANTAAFVSSQTPESLGEEIEIPGFGKNSRGYFINIITVVHPSNHCGEIAAMKGMNGLKGYPF